MLKLCRCVSLVRDLALLGHFFCKKLRVSYTLQDFLFRDMYFGCREFEFSHHASVVRELKYMPKYGGQIASTNPMVPRGLKRTSALLGVFSKDFFKCPPEPHILIGSSKKASM